MANIASSSVIFNLLNSDLYSSKPSFSNIKHTRNFIRLCQSTTVIRFWLLLKNKTSVRQGKLRPLPDMGGFCSLYHSFFPVTIQIKLDQSFRLNLFLSYLQRIAFLGELLGQRSRHESLRRPLIEPVRRHIVLNTFGSLESRDFRTRKNPSINRFSLAVSSLPHIPY